MLRPCPPLSRDAARVAVAAALALPALALLPGSASAAGAAANTWAGGSAGAARSATPVAGRRYAARGALVSVVTGAGRARLVVSVRSDRCVVNGTMRGRSVARPGGTGELLALAVQGSRTLTTASLVGRTRARVKVTLVPGAPGLMVGTVEARGRVRLDGRSRACSMRETVTVRSRAALAGPIGPLSPDPLAPRSGLVGTRLATGVPGSIALTGRRDGLVHGFWILHVSCRSGPKRSTDDVVNIIRPFRVRPDGSFRDREVVTTRSRVPEGRRTLRFTATIAGRIGPDGVARGTVRTQSRDRFTGYDDLVCSSPSTPFTAAPVR